MALPRESPHKADKFHLRRFVLLNAADAKQNNFGQDPKHGDDPTVTWATNQTGQDLTFGQDPTPTTEPDSVGARVKQQQEQQAQLIEAFAAEIETMSSHHVPYEVMQVPNSEVENEMENPLYAFKAKTDPDTMYLHEALKEPDRKEFIQAMDKELRDQLKHGNFTVVHKSTVPEGATVLPTVWAMQ